MIWAETPLLERFFKTILSLFPLVFALGISAAMWVKLFPEEPEWQEAYQEYQDENTVAVWFRSLKTGEWRLDRVIKKDTTPWLVFTDSRSAEYREAFARKPAL